MAKAKKQALASSFGNMTLVMTILTVVSAGLLGLTYTGTKDRIAENALNKQRDALGLVLPAFDNDPVAESTPGSDADLVLYPARTGGERTGTAVLSYSDLAFGGRMSVMVGFDAEGRISGVQTVGHTETPGLGSKITLPNFTSQFLGQTAEGGRLAVDKDGGEVDAITAATISSRAFVDAVNRAREAVRAEEGQ